MEPSLVRKVLFTVIPLLVILSVIIIGLSESSITFISNNMGEEFYLDAAGADHYALGALPLDFHYDVVKFTAATGFTSAGISIGFLIFMLCTGKDGVQFSRRRIHTTLLILNTILVLSLLITLNIVHTKSTRFNIHYTSKYGGYGPSNIYDKGVFNLETWTCELNSVTIIAEEEQSNIGGDMGRQCMIERATRWMVVPLFVLAAIVAGLAVWELVRMERGRKAGELEEQELYGINRG